MLMLDCLNTYSTYALLRIELFIPDFAPFRLHDAHTPSWTFGLLLASEAGLDRRRRVESHREKGSQAETIIL